MMRAGCTLVTLAESMRVDSSISLGESKVYSTLNLSNCLMCVLIAELLITSGGENIPPVMIESAIKSELPFVNNVMVVGDRRKYLTCLITLLVRIEFYAR